MGDISTEPSMEDILSSIKRIIAEEGEPGAAARARRPARPLPASDSSRTPASEPDEVLELSEPVSSRPEREPRAQDAANTRDEEERILSERVAAASRGQLEALSRLVVRPETPGSDTLEGLVREMLRPMLREWLDANLPTLVERMVAREIARISRNG